MPSHVVALPTKAFSIILTFVVPLAVTTLIAYLAARAWGRKSRRRKQAIYSIVGIVGLIAAGLFTQSRIPHFAQPAPPLAGASLLQAVTLGGGQTRYVVPSMLAGQTALFRVTVPPDTPVGKIVRIAGAQYAAGPWNRIAAISATADGPPFPGAYSSVKDTPSPQLIGKIGTSADGTLPTAAGAVAAIARGSTFYVRVTNQNTPPGTRADLAMDFNLQSE